MARKRQVKARGRSASAAYRGRPHPPAGANPSPVTENPSQLETGQRVRLNVESMTAEGQGIARVGGYVVFVSGAIPAETVDAEIEFLGADFGRARTLQAVAGSRDRVEPVCRHAGVCGGCVWQHISYEAQLQWKEELLRSVLSHRLPRVRLPIRPMFGVPHPWGTRHKIHYSLVEYGRGASKRCGLGHHRAGTDRLLAVEECPVHHPAGEALARKVFHWLRNRGVPVAAPHRTTAGLKSILVRTAGNSGRSHVVLVATGDSLNGVDAELVDAVLALPEVDGVHLNVQPDPGSTYVGEVTKCLGGNARLLEKVGGLTFHVSPDVFFQTNAVAAQKMLDVVLAFAGDAPDEPRSDVPKGRKGRTASAQDAILDLYAGVGLFSLPLAAAGFKVTAVEENPRSVADGIESVRRNGIRRCRFVESRVQPYLKRIPRDTRFGTVILDPPRSGCPEWAIRILGRGLRPQRVINVSCNPQALASDLSVLTQSGYKVREIQPIDMFPHTPHIESVTLLERS